MNILGVLKSKFKVVEPIFERDILALGYSLDDINDTLEENVFEKVAVNIQGFDFGNVYVLPQYSELFDLYARSIDKFELIRIYFLGDNFEKGYYSGVFILNVLGLCNQMFLSQTLFSRVVVTPLRITVYNTDIVINPLSDKYCKEDAFNIMFSEALNKYSNCFDNSWSSCLIDLIGKNLVSLDMLQMIEKESDRIAVKKIFTQ